MIVDDINDRFEAALGDQAADIDLQWNFALGAQPRPQGVEIVVEAIVSCRSPIVGERLWQLMHVHPDVFLTDPKELRKFAFDLTQRMIEMRNRLMQVAHGPNGQAKP